MIRSRREPAIRTLSRWRLAVMKLNVLIRKIVLDLNARAARVVIVKLPRRYCAIVLHAGADFDHARGTKVGPVEFFLARPDEFDRLATPPREPRRFDRALARVLAAVSGAGVGRNHADLLFGNMKRFREFRPDAEGALRAGPNRQLAISPLGERGAWLERRVCDVGDGVRLRQFLIGGRHAVRDRTDRTATTTATRSRSILLQVIEQLIVTRLTRGLPVNRNRFLCSYRSLQIRRGHADEVAVVNNDYARHRFSRFRIAGDERRLERRRSDYASIQHPFTLQIGRVLMLAVYEVAPIDLRHRRAGDSPITRRRDRNVRRDRFDELLSFRDFRARQ